MVEQTKTVQSYLSHFFKYEKNYNETLKDVSFFLNMLFI